MSCIGEYLTKSCIMMVSCCLLQLLAHHPYSQTSTGNYLVPPAADLLLSSQGGIYLTFHILCIILVIFCWSHQTLGTFYHSKSKSK